MNGVDPLLPARKVKHALFVQGKRLRRTGRAALFGAATLTGPLYSRWRPFEYDPARYRRSFLVREAPPTGGLSPVPWRVFVLWVGDNPLTPRRRENLATLRDRLGVPVEVVTSANLHEWVLPGHPLHPAYEHLSLIHRSDYLRAYLMHHHGGGYCDVKSPLASWDGAFARMVDSPDVWMTGFPELSAGMVTRAPGRLGRDLAMHHSRLVGMSAFIMRPGTPLTAEWIREVERRLNYYMDQMKEFPGGARGEVVGYPISWTRLLGGVLHPLQLKYLEHIRQDPDLLLEFTDYQ